MDATFLFHVSKGSSQPGGHILCPFEGLLLISDPWRLVAETQLALRVLRSTVGLLDSWTLQRELDNILLRQTEKRNQLNNLFLVAPVQ